MQKSTQNLVGLASLTLLMGCSAPAEKNKDKIDPVMLKAASYQARKQYSRASDTTTLTFLNRLKSAVAKDKVNIDQFSQLISYPCRVDHPGNESTLLDNKKQLAENIEILITPEIREQILKIDLDSLYINTSGLFRIGDGDILFDPLKGITAFKAIR